jgi:GDA1/CD39 (nucleoside phosphatase) family
MSSSCVKLHISIALFLCMLCIALGARGADSALDNVRSNGLYGKSVRRSPGTLAARIRSRRTVNYEYAVVIDAGSSGSRVRVYQWPDRIGGKRVETSGIRVMQPQLKLQPGLSKQVEDLAKVRDHIRQLIVNASRHVPNRHHKYTPIYFMATAGQSFARRMSL